MGRFIECCANMLGGPGHASLVLYLSIRETSDFLNKLFHFFDTLNIKIHRIF